MLGISITLTLYLDRGRRADIAQLRADLNENAALLRRDMETGFKESRSELKGDMETGFKRIDKRLDKLTDVVMDLCRRVGRLEGRIEASDPKADTSS
ncbi:hypothetical protein [Candidatus Poriferisocius sp.]|uniref:hypothetical protein n=1 Tax=Candidatus Poriferisocius sp. TaxID=3101276 RepID=UPI003B0120F3